MKKIRFIDLNKQYNIIKKHIDYSVMNVIKKNDFILGKQVDLLEHKISNFCGIKNTIACANGTDAILLSLMALDIKANDIIFVPSFTFISTAEMVALNKSIPYFIDINKDTYNINADHVEENIKFLEKKNKKVKCIICVDLFGRPSDYQRLEEISKKYKIKLIVDAAQSFGAKYFNKRVGNFGDITTTSFFPSKPLGCFGDGGAILTNDKKISEKIRSLKSHGKGKNKYDNIYVGINSRLDTIQAAVLIEKLKIFSREIKNRNIIANNYTNKLDDNFFTPKIERNMESVWAQYTIIPKNNPREYFIEKLKKKKIPYGIYYPKPLHLQKAYTKFPKSILGLKNSEFVARNCFSLPMHPYLDNEQQEYIIRNLIT